MYLPQIDKSTKGKSKYRFQKASNTEDQHFLIPQVNIDFFLCQVFAFSQQFLFRTTEINFQLGQAREDFGHWCLRLKFKVRSN